MTLPIPRDLKPMLSKLKPEMPRGEGFIYEPKWDGFRALVFRDGDEIEVVSRDQKSLNRYFPELLPVLKDALPERVVIDGEVVVSNDDGLDFDELQLRIHPAESRVKMLAEQLPASFVAFDVLAIEDEALMEVGFAERRARLEEIVDEPRAFTPEQRGSYVWLTPQTDDPDVAVGWFDDLEHLGIEGLIVKRPEQTYRPGDRAMVKVKHLRTVDCVVGGYRLNKAKDGIGSLLLGLYDDGGVLHYVGHTSSFKAPERRRLLAELKEMHGDSFGGGRAPGGPSRWNQGKVAEWFPVKPELVCEITVDKMQGHRFRHAAGFVRWRPDRTPESCKLDQVAPPTRPG